MTFEVELKFPLADAADITLQLLALGAARGRVLEQYDLYFRHPSRDFRQTHEALRIRRSGTETFITYKGPVVDARTKTRHEVEIPFGREPADFERLRDLFTTLGFEAVRPVEKTRGPLYHLNWSGRDLELAVDSIDGLGTFLEIESLSRRVRPRCRAGRDPRAGGASGFEECGAPIVPAIADGKGGRRPFARQSRVSGVGVKSFPAPRVSAAFLVNFDL